MLRNEICDTQTTRNPSPLERLKDRESRLTEDLRKTKEAITTLEANPDMVKVIEALQISY